MKKSNKKLKKFGKSLTDNVISNTFKSIGSLTVTELSDAMPFLSQVKSDAKDIISDISSKTNDIKKESSKSLVKFIKEEKISPNIKKFTSNLKADLISGNWNTSRGNDLEDLGFDDLDEYDSSGDSSDSNTYGPENLSAGETFIAEANARVVNNSTNRITDAINSSTMASININKELTLKSLKFNSTVLNNGFSALNTGISSLVTFNATIMNDHVNNSRNYYSTMMENSSTIISLLKEIKDSQASGYNNEESGDNKSAFRRIFGPGDSFNLGELFKLYTEQAFTDFDAFKEPFLTGFKDIINNPMRTLTKSAIKRMTKRTSYILGDIDSGINDLITNVVNKIGNNEWINALTGVSLSTSKSITSHNYYKGDLKWNGYSQKSIMDVIPGYLSRIESFLTKQPEIIFDYESGKWKTKGIINKSLKEKVKIKGKSAGGDLFDAIFNVVDDKKLSIKEKESFKKGINELSYKIMDTAMNGKDVFKEISRNKLLTSSSILNNALMYILKTDDIDYKLDNKTKNRISAELIRAANDLSDEFTEISNNISSVFHIKDMESEINNMLKIRNIQNNYGSYSYDNSDNYPNKNAYNKKKRKNKSSNLNDQYIKNAIKLNKDNEERNFDSRLKYSIDNFKTKYNNIKDSDIYDKNNGKIIDLDKFYYSNDKTRNKINTLVAKYNADNWYRFLKDFKDPDLSYKDFLKLWNTNEDYRYSIAIDLLYRTGDIDLYFSVNKNKAEKMLDETIKRFEDINNYKTKTREEILKSSKITYDESNSLYGITSEKEFVKSKLKSKKDIKNQRYEEMESFLRDASDFTVNNLNKDGEFSAFQALKSTLSLPDKFIYGMFKKVDTYVYKTLFDDGRFFGDESYKGLIPTIKDEVVNQMKEFGKDLEREVLEPLSQSAKSEEMSGVVGKVSKMLGIDGDINEYKKNISKYFNGERDENGDLIQIGLKHKIVDSLKKDSKSIFNLGKDTILDIMSLGKKYDGGYAEGGFIGSGKTKDGRPNYDKVIGDYEPEKDALTDFISKLLWDSGNIPAFAKGGRLQNINKNRKNRSVLMNTNRYYSPKQHNVAKNVEIVDGENDGVVITAQAGEAILTEDQTKSLIDRLNANIKNGTATEEDIELAKTLGIKYRFDNIRKKSINFIKNTKSYLSSKLSEDNNTDVFSNLKIFKDVNKKSIESITGKDFSNFSKKFTKSKEFANIVGEEGRKYTSDIISGSAIGLGLSLFTGLINPFLGLSLGAGIGLASKSNKVQESLFGSDEKDSILNKDIGKYIKEKLPKTAMGGILGSVGSSVILGSPVPGLILGSALSHVSQNDELKMKLFGTGDPEKYLKKKENLKKILPSMGIGAAALTLTGPFGLVGNVLLGSAAGAGIGILGISDKFQKAIFGEKGSDGKYYGGLLPTFRENILEPLADSLSNMFKDTKKWLKDAIYDNIKKGLNPLRKMFSGAAKRLWRGTKSIIKKGKTRLGNSFLGRKVRRFGRKVNVGLLKTGEFAGKITRGTLGLGPKAFGWIGEEANKHMIRTNGGIGSGEYTAQERYDLANKYGIEDGMQDITDLLMQANQDGNLQQKLDLRDALRYVNNITDNDSRIIERNKLIKSSAKKLNDFAIRINKSGGWKDEKKYVKLLKSGNFQGAFDLLNKTNLDEGIKADLLEDLSPKLDEIERLNKTDTSYDTAYNFLKSKNISDDMISKIISKDRNDNVILNKKFKLLDKLSYINKDIDKGSFDVNDIYKMTKNERSKVGKLNRLSSIDNLSQQIFERGSKSDLMALNDAVMNMHLSGKDIKLLLNEGKSTDKIKGYDQYKFLSSLGIDDNLLDTFNEKDKISISKSIQSLMAGIKDDVGFSREFKDYLDISNINKSNNSHNNELKAKTPDELISIDNVVKKYLPLIAAGTGSITDISTIQDDLKSINRSTSSLKPVSSNDIKSIKKSILVSNSNLESNVYKIKNEKDEDDSREINGKKQIKTKNGDWVYDKSDKTTREILKTEENDRKIKNSFFSKFSSIDFSKLSFGGNKEDNSKSGSLFENILSGLSKLSGPLLMLLGSSFLSKLSNDSTGNIFKDGLNNMGKGLLSTLQGIFGIDNNDVSSDGRTSSDEADNAAKESRTPIQNLLNNTLGRITGRDGYMGNADTIDGASSTLGKRMLRGVANTLDKFVFKSKTKGQSVVFKNLVKSPFTAIKNTAKFAFTKTPDSFSAQHIEFPKDVDDAEKVVDKSSSLASKIKNSKLGTKITESTKDLSDSFNKTKEKVGGFFKESTEKVISKFNSIIDKFYEAINNVPDFSKVFSDSKFVNQLTEFCSDKAVLNKIPFEKIASYMGEITNKLAKRVASASDNLLKKGVSAINKFLAKTTGKAFKSEAKSVPYLGVALAVIDVIYGMVNFRDILGISLSSSLSLLQNILYRILGGLSYFLLNLPFIWVASLLLSEEFIVGLVLDLADIILPNTKLSSLRKDAESEIETVNKKLVAKGKDPISTVTQLNEYNKRQEKKKSKWNPLNWFSKDENKEEDTKTQNTNKAALSLLSSDLSKYNKNSNSIINQNNNFGIGGPAVNENQIDFVGKYVKQFESGDKGSKSISSGKGDYGGVSYGTYQFASYSQDGGNIGGPAKAFWDTYYKKNHPNLKLVNNNDFKNTWISEVDKDPNGFFGNEHAYIMNKYYKPILEGVPNLNEFIKSRAMQESILSTSVQYGNLAKSVFKNVIKNKNPDNISQYDLIGAIQDYKYDNVDNHFTRSSSSTKNNLKNIRIPKEKSILQNLVNMPTMDTSKVIGDVSTLSSSSSDYADSSTLNNEGNTSLSPGNNFLDFISDIGTIIKTMFGGSSSNSTSDVTNSETYSESSGGSPATISGLTSADDHFGYKVTSKFGEQRGSQFHNGIDYGMPTGTPVVTPVSGKIEINKDNPGGYGNYIGLRDNNKMLHIFGHLSDRSKVKKGQTVSAGDVVGLSGNTGASTGPHLHYEVTNTLGAGRKAQDPNQYLAAISQSAKSAESLDNKDNNVSTSGVGGPSVSLDKIETSSNSKVEELLSKIVNLLTISNINTSLIQNVLNVLTSISNGDLSVNSDNGKEAVDKLKDDIKTIKNDKSLKNSINGSDLFKQLENLVLQ